MHGSEAELTTNWRPWAVSLVTLIVFFVLNEYDWTLFRSIAADTEGYLRLGAVTGLRYLPQLIIPLVLAGILVGWKNAPDALGLSSNPLTGFIVAVASTSVMLLAIAVTSDFVVPDNFVITVSRGAILPGIFEEIFYRAFLFGFLFRFAKWGFLPAALVGAIVFGAGHLYQSGDPTEATAIFTITALGALWFAWLYVEWGYNVWVPAAMHLLMNLWWELFAVSDSALGPMSANVSRIGVIVLSILITVWFAKRHGGRRIKGVIWMRQPAA
ncbi:MAG: CPBP family intramembrane glutamic endopeptidase [Pseudomonadota bacterium]